MYRWSEDVSVQSILYTTTAHLWLNYRKASLRKLQVAYNDAMRILLKRPRWSSASEMFVAAGVNTLQAVLRNLMYKCICRLNDSDNEILLALSNIRFSTTRYQSQLWRHWYSCLFVGHWFKLFLNYEFFLCCVCNLLYVMPCLLSGPWVCNKVFIHSFILTNPTSFTLRCTFVSF